MKHTPDMSKDNARKIGHLILKIVEENQNHPAESLVALATNIELILDDIENQFTKENFNSLLKGVFKSIYKKVNFIDSPNNFIVEIH